MTDQYVPSEPFARSLYVHRSRTSSPDISTDQARAEFDRFLARVRRDAAREALDGLADSWEARGRVAGAHSARIYRDTHHPETEDYR